MHVQARDMLDSLDLVVAKELSEQEKIKVDNLERSDKMDGQLQTSSKQSKSSADGEDKHNQCGNDIAEGGELDVFYGENCSPPANQNLHQQVKNKISFGSFRSERSADVRIPWKRSINKSSLPRGSSGGYLQSLARRLQAGSARSVEHLASDCTDSSDAPGDSQESADQLQAQVCNAHDSDQWTDTA